MIKLNPPYIENILPPFVIYNNEGVLDVPFSLPQTIGYLDIKNEQEAYEAHCIVRNVFNNEIIADKIGSVSFDLTNTTIGSAHFTISEISELKSGQYYKVQIALRSSTGEDGYFSSVGITRCIKKPEITIVDLEKNSILNKPSYKYTGKCILNEPTEKIATYKFTL